MNSSNSAFWEPAVKSFTLIILSGYTVTLVPEGHVGIKVINPKKGEIKENRGKADKYTLF